MRKANTNMECLQCNSKFTNNIYYGGRGEVFCVNCVNEFQLELQKNLVSYFCMGKVWRGKPYYYFEDNPEIESYENFRKKRGNPPNPKLDQKDRERAGELFWYWWKNKIIKDD